MSTARVIKKINPADLSEEDNQILSSFLREHKETDFVPKNTSLEVKTESSEAQFELTHPLLRRECASQKNKGQHRYEVLSDKILGVPGSFGVVTQILRTLALEQNGLVNKTEKPDGRVKSRVAKHFNGERDALNINPDLIKREHELTPSHLKMKPPVFLAKPDAKMENAYLVMRRLPGEELYALILAINEARPTELKTVDRRLSLTLAILRAYKTQVMDRGLVHRDIKPENILLDYSNPDNPVVNIIDYNLSKKSSESDLGQRVGSLAYIGPETIRFVNRLATSTKSDIYALSLVIGYVWGAWPIEIGQKDTDIKALGVARTYEFPHLCEEGWVKGNRPEQAEHRDAIKVVLKAMQSPESENRPSIDEAIEVFEWIRKDRQQIKQAASAPADQESQPQAFSLRV